MTPWTEVASVIVLGIGANTENLPVGFAYGLRRLRIGFVRNLLIAAVTTFAALVPLSVGRGLRAYVSTAAPNVIAGLLLVGLGFFNAWLERRSSGSPIKAPEASGSGTDFYRSARNSHPRQCPVDQQYRPGLRGRRRRLGVRFGCPLGCRLQRDTAVARRVVESKARASGGRPIPLAAARWKPSGRRCRHHHDHGCIDGLPPVTRWRSAPT